MIKFMRGVIGLLLLSAVVIVTADPIADIYQIEVIVFAHTNQDRFSSEHWPKFVGKLDTKHAINLNKLNSKTPDAIDTLETLDALDDVGDQPISKVIKESINIIEPKSYLLNYELRTLKNNKSVRVIKHLAWSQPLATNVKSTPVYFTAGKDKEIAAVISIKPVKNLFGVHVDMIYKIQPEDLKSDPGVEEIRITRDVKLKKKEAYYIDHPVVGMIMIISPIIYSSP